MHDQTDWRLAATTCGNNIHLVNPDLLIIVEGLNYDNVLTFVASLPVVLDQPNKLVYEAHNYEWQQV